MYDWLLKIVSKIGSLIEEGELDFVLGDIYEEEGSKREKERFLIGMFFFF